MSVGSLDAKVPARAKAAGAFNEEHVVEVRHWSDRLFSFRTTRQPSFRFDSGQFAMIGLLLEGRPLLRAYSMASGYYEDFLEFYSIKVPDGPLTSRLQHIQAGETVLVGRKPTGTLLLGSLKPGRRLYLLSTGTGIAPFSSLIKDPEVYERFENVVLAHGCRRVVDLDYGIDTVLKIREDALLGEYAVRQLLYYPTATREPYRNQGRLTEAVSNGRLWTSLALPPLDPEHDRVMICGCTPMLVELVAMLKSRGFCEGSGAAPGDYVIERAFVER